MNVTNHRHCPYIEIHIRANYHDELNDQRIRYFKPAEVWIKVYLRGSIAAQR